MKKKLKSFHPFSDELTKFLLIMRIFTLLLLISTLSVSASVYSQTTKIKLAQKNSTIRQVFDEIEKQTSFKIFYLNEQIDDKLMVELTTNAATVEEVLNEIFDQNKVKYKVFENNLIVISPKFVETAVLQSKITGTVTDFTTKEPLIGVTILVEGTTIGTVTDVNGRFSVEAPAGVTLVISYVGYLAEKIALNGRSVIDVALVPDITKLDEIVVIGYGTQKKVNLTGAVGTVKMDDMESRPLTSSSLALQGTVSGVYALQNSGKPGSDDASIRIRGVGTTNDANPLVLVDGFPGNMNDVDANDIASISVLKDAASSAIYGNRAANGVILITTKHGASDKMKVSYTAYFGQQQATSLPKVLNSVEYTTLYNEAALNSGQPAIYTASDIQKFADHNDPMYPDIDYFKVYYGKASTQNHRFNLSGGTESLQYAFMLGHLDQDGILVGTGYKKTDFRSNIDAYLLKDKRLRFSSKISGNLGVTTEPTDLWSAEWYATLAPVIPLTNAQGQWMSARGERNYYGEIKEGSTKIIKRYAFNGQLEAEYKIVKGLSAQVTYGYNVVNSNTNAFHANVTLVNANGSTQQLTSDLTKTNALNIQTLLTSLLKYQKKLGKHEINLLAGYSEEAFNWEWDNGYRSGFVNNEQRILNLGNAATQKNDAGAYDLGLKSLFGRIGYAFDEKYLLEANLRKDGSSRFASGLQWGTFPSFSAGWNVSKEDFMKDQDWLSLLKIRGSWGRLGNQNINTYYAGYDILTAGQNYSLGGSLNSGVAVNNFTNKKVTWETTDQTNIGIDLVLKKGFELTADYFNKTTSDILYQVPIPQTMGALTAPYANAYQVSNKGIELSITYRKTFANDFKFRSTLNLSHIINKITDLKGSAPIINGAKAYVKGSAVNSFYGYKMDGVYQISDFTWQNNSDPTVLHADRTYTLKPGVVTVENFKATPGDIKYRDFDGDGKVTMANDRTVLGKQFPDLSYSLNLSAEWKHFDLGLFFQGVQGIQGYTYYEIATAFSGAANLGNWWNDRWTPTNPTNKTPKLSLDGARNNIHSTFYMENASYLRLKNFELGYTLNKKFITAIGLSSVRIYGNVQNAFTITKFKGFDPEQATDQTRAEAYPQVRVVSFGVNVNF